jgi:hypothetical protein
VTLCIAAECKRGRSQSVILASDYETENEMVGAEIQPKLAWIGDKHVALLAGTSSRAVEFVMLCEGFFGTEEGKRLDTFDKLREVVLIQKKRLADELLAGQLGVTYEFFLRTGKEAFPDDLFREVSFEIKQTTLACSLIVVTIAEGHPKIFRVHETGMVEICHNFAAVGTGLYIAESLLFLREYNADISLRDGMYSVFEAMTFGSRAPGVGEAFSVSIVSEKQGKLIWEYPNEEYRQYLEKQVPKFGLRTLTGIQCKSNWIEVAKE